MPNLDTLTSASAGQLLIRGRLTAGPMARVGAAAVDPAPSALPAAPYAYYGDNVLKARAVALPRADRPKLFAIANSVLGPATSGLPTEPVDPSVLAASLETLALLGHNVVAFDHFGTQQASAVAVAATWGLTRFKAGVFSPPFYFRWETGFTEGQMTAWIANLVNYVSGQGIPLGGVEYFQIMDEPGWYHPANLTLLRASAQGVLDFQAYLAALGFTPGDFGGVVWSDVLPAGWSDVVDQPSSMRYYHTMRFIVEGHCSLIKTSTEALKVAFHAQIRTAMNWNNTPGRWYQPSPGKPISNGGDTSLDSAAQAPDWPLVGRRDATNLMWTEDWFADGFAELWSFQGALLRCAAQGRHQIGGYVVGNTMGNPGDTGAGGRYKALSFIGQGAKTIEYWNFGPTELFAINGWSWKTPVYAEIADANRLIARAEDLLYPGVPVAAKIAIVLPVPAWVWDIHLGTLLDTTNETLFMRELRGLFYGLTHAGYAVDFLSEEDVVAQIGNYAVVYLVGQECMAAVQAALVSWITAGGVAAFLPGAVAYDEYHQRTTTLDAARGITVQALPKYYTNDPHGDQIVFTTNGTLINGAAIGPVMQVGGYVAQVEHLTVTTATVLATFDEGLTPAIAAHAVGSGLVLSYGMWVGSQYLSTPTVVGVPMAEGWFANWRAFITAPVRMAVPAPLRLIQVDREDAEMLRLDSAAGIAIVGLNWTNTPIAALAVTVRNCPPITRAVLSDTLTDIAFSQVGSTVTVTMPLATVDVLKLYA